MSIEQDVVEQEAELRRNICSECWEEIDPEAPARGIFTAVCLGILFFMGVGLGVLLS